MLHGHAPKRAKKLGNAPEHYLASSPPANRTRSRAIPLAEPRERWKRLTESITEVAAAAAFHHLPSSPSPSPSFTFVSLQLLLISPVYQFILPSFVYLIRYVKSVNK